MKRIVVTALMLLLPCSIFADDRYADYAQEWRTAVAQAHPNDEEKTLLLNLVYWSWQRSESVLRLQKSVTDYMHQTGSAVNSAMAARLNPAKMSSILNYSSAHWERDLATFDRVHARFRKELAYYRQVSATYAHCLEYLVKGDVRDEIKEVVALVRDNSRLARMQVMQEQMSSLSALMDQMKKIMKSLKGETRNALHESSRGLLDSIMQFAQPGVFNSFAKFDKNYNLFNEKAWHVLTSSYALSNLLWEITEEVRVQFYAEHYTQLTQWLGCRVDHQHLLVRAFDADGFIEVEKRNGNLALVSFDTNRRSDSLRTSGEHCARGECSEHREECIEPFERNV